LCKGEATYITVDRRRLGSQTECGMRRSQVFEPRRSNSKRWEVECCAYE